VGGGRRRTLKLSPNDLEPMPNDVHERPYKLYRSSPRGLRSLFRGEDAAGDRGPGGPALRDPAPRGADGYGPRRNYGRSTLWSRLRSRVPGPARPAGPAGPATRPKRPITAWRVIRYVLLALVLWVGLSFVLFMISASNQAGTIPASAQAELSSGGNMLFSANNILIIGTDQRPRTGPGSKEPGSNYSDSGSRSDTIMLWRVGGGTSRRLSIPRDTAVDIPGHGVDKINAAYAIGGPALAIKTIKQFTGLKINHIIIVNLANFPKFIDAIGGITLRTDHVCSTISGGRADGGFTFRLSAGTHHLTGEEALLLARTRENSCNPAENDLTREKRQQAILNAIKGQLFSFTTFIHLPWAAWDAPQALRSDMGGLTLMSLFGASELGGSAPIDILRPTGGEVLPNGGDALTVSPSAVRSAVNRFQNG
jgi:LCP family protein required for cell wall assembly